LDHKRPDVFAVSHFGGDAGRGIACHIDWDIDGIACDRTRRASPVTKVAPLLRDSSRERAANRSGSQPARTRLSRARRACRVMLIWINRGFSYGQ
jgi:hypothetical protein